MFKRILIILLIVSAVIGLGIYLSTISKPKQQANPNLVGEKVVTREYSHMTGNAGAKVTLVEFGDFQCPFCAAANPVVNQVVEKYRSNPDFNFVFREFPLPAHANAQISAEAAEAAGAQGKFWEMKDLLYQHQNDWSGSINPTSTLRGFAQQLGIDSAKFESELKSNKYVDQITQDQKDGEAWVVPGTPTFILNGETISTYLELDSKIGELLK